MDAITDHQDQHLDSLKNAEQMVCTLSTSASQTVYLQIDSYQFRNLQDKAACLI